MLIILDRDGVINQESHEYIKSPAEWIEIPGSLAAIARLKQAGHTVMVATNQSGIARQLFTEAILADIHHKMQMALQAHQAQLDGIYYCPHHPDDGCGCRKPQPGLLQQIAAETQTDLSHAIMVGDSWRDLQAGMAVGARPVLVRTGNGRMTLAKKAEACQAIDVYDDLAHFALEFERMDRLNT